MNLTCRKSEMLQPNSLYMHVQVMYDQVLEHTDAGVAVEDAVVTFDTLGVLIPRGRFDVELYPSFMKLLGQVHIQLPST